MCTYYSLRRFCTEISSRAFDAASRLSLSYEGFATGPLDFVRARDAGGAAALARLVAGALEALPTIDTVKVEAFVRQITGVEVPTLELTTQLAAQAARAAGLSA